MASVAELVGVEVLRKLALPDDYDWGVEASDRGDVALETLEEDHVAARIAEHPGTVELRSDDDVLRWSCSCDQSEKTLCRHGVAAAVETWRQTPPGSAPL